MELPTLNKNIRKIIEEKFSGNESSFSEFTGIGQASINRLFRIDKRIGKYPDASKSNKINYVNIILEKFPDINKDWLVGFIKDDSEWLKMQGKPLDSNYAKVDNQWQMVQEESEHYNVTPIDNDNYMIVEYADLRVSAGPLGTKNLNALPKSKTRLVPKEYDNGEYMVLRVDGPSMDNGTSISIPDGTEILVKKYYLHNGDKLPIRNNLFVIDAKDGQALKQIIEHNTEEGYIICHSYNPEFKDYKVMLEDILQIFIYRKIVSSRPPIPDIS